MFVTPLFTRPAFFTDTDFGSWGGDWSRSSDCLRLGKVPCLNAGISKFPPAYLLNSYYVSFMDARGFERAWALGLLNTIFLALPIAFIALVSGVRASLSRSLVYVVAVLLTAIPPFYVYSGALEVQAGILIGIFIACLVLMNDDAGQPRRRALTILLFLTALLLPLYKDTNIVIVGAGLMVVGMQRWRRNRNATEAIEARPPLWQTALPLSVALAVGLAISMAYNFLKFESVLPLVYLQEASQASPPPAQILEFFAATYLSPNGGVIVFWAGALCAMFWLLRSFDLIVSRTATSVAVVVVLIYSAILAGWWATFGWDSWGDRLMIPVMLAMVVCVTATARGPRVELQAMPNHRDGLESAKPSYGIARVIRTGAVLVFLALSLHYTVVSYYADKEAVINASLYSGSRCQQMVRDLKAMKAMGLAFWRTDSYYACARERFMYVPRYINND